jgi:hypothetical protein
MQFAAMVAASALAIPRAAVDAAVQDLDTGFRVEVRLLCSTSSGM